MRKAALICCLWLIFPTAANAGIVVELLPGSPPPNADGTYNGAESLDVNVRLTSDMTINVRLLQFDHTASTPGLVLGRDIDNGLPIYEPTAEHPFDGVPNFIFDYSTLSAPNGYTDFSNLRAGTDRRTWPASTVYTGITGAGGDFLTLQAGVPFHAGTMPVTLPSAAGTYVLDLLNASETDPNLGTIVAFDAPGRIGATVWGSINDGDVEVSYASGSGPTSFVVIAEPATLLLLALGGLGALYRRRG